jgi:hypothetical protein
MRQRTKRIAQKVGTGFLRKAMRDVCSFSSFPRRRESSFSRCVCKRNRRNWIPACAGMTNEIQENQKAA